MIPTRAFLVFAAILLVVPRFGDAADDPQMLELRGATMGTKYVVKIFDPPEFDSDIRFDIDAELRRVNDQMSTYLKSSELSRFNVSESTDWFAVSKETADVVAFAQQVSKKTEGAFDVTVGPLVNAWSFGPEPRTGQVPTAGRIDELKKSVGYQNLSVRSDPPALRKSVPGLQVDLSALAKGHGVDRVVELLDSLGAANVFVEIGGEVRTSGDKAGVAWRVGIQMPDATKDTVMIGHPMSESGADEAMATSGDYRNVFVADGKRYSHTIDPRTGSPIIHTLASVSVIAPDCMAADAWATAINVLGPEDGLQVAQRENLSVLLVSRDGESLSLSGRGVLSQYVPPKTSSDEAGRSDEREGNSPLAVVLLTFIAFAGLLIAMAIGVIFGRRAISGSCGGLSNASGEGGSCALCSNPSDACKELRGKMGKEAEAGSPN